MTASQAISSLLEQAQRHILTAQSLYETRHYDWCLFMWQLVLEKSLKALILTRGLEMKYVHDLVRLASLASLPLDQDQITDLTQITDFNIEARYDDFKRELYLKANVAFTDIWVAKSKHYYELILREIC